MSLDLARARALALSTDVSRWQHALSRYEDAIHSVAAAKKRPKLVQLDLWLRNDYPSLVASQGYIGLEELQKVMEWKITRGKFRPLMGQIKKNTEEAVTAITQEAFASLREGDYMHVIGTLSQLKGVGVATASALVAPLRGSMPFMDDVAIELSNPVREYTAPIYRRMRTYLTDIATTLGDEWDAEAVCRALWATAVLGSSEGAVEQETKTEDTLATGKRRRGSAGGSKKAPKTG